MQIANNRQQLIYKATPPTHISCCFADASMSLLKYIKSSVGLPTAEQTGQTETAVSSANTTLQDMLEEVREKESASSQHKYTKIFTAEDCAKVGK